jgi:hypothetical protein
MKEAGNKDFFSNLWKCPIRRWWRYGRRLMLVFLLGIVLWIGLDFLASGLFNKSPFVFSVLLHSTLTVSLGLILTAITQYFYIRLSSRFRSIKAFRRKTHAP